MPDKKGRFSGAEREFVGAFAATGDRQYAQWKAGYVNPSAVTMALQRPAVQAEIRAIQQKRLMDEGLPLAVDTVIGTMNDATAPRMARLKAAEITFKLTLGVADDAARKDIASMSAVELQSAVDLANRRIAELNGTIIDVEPDPIEPPEQGVFD